MEDKKILCYHHNDMDGRSAGAVVAHYFGIEDGANFHEVNYDGNLPDIENAKDFDQVIFVDYSFTEKTCNVLKDLIKKEVNVIWIDHHDSSIRLIKDHPEFELPGIVKDGISGAALAYMYFYNVQYDEIPYFLKLVSDYDCWILKLDPLSSYFKLGIDMVDSNPFSDTWKNLLNNPEKASAVNAICETGKVIKMYVDKTNKETLEAASFETELSGHKCLAVNARGNSWVFGDKIKEYPLVCLFHYDKDKYEYSLYSNGYGNINCGKIAENYGGGGHVKAAGFKSKKFIFG